MGQLMAHQLFNSEDILDITLSGNIHGLMGQRIENDNYFPMTISFKEKGIKQAVPVRVKTRGHYRLSRGNCTYPPLLLNFSKERSAGGSLFDGLNKVKLVTPCRGEKYVIHEYLVYKLYNLVTDKSLRARLVRVTYEDSVKSKQRDRVFGILLEEDDEMAMRHNCVVVGTKAVRPEQTTREDFLKLAVFEYMIGNTDWSVQYLQNIKLIGPDTLNNLTAVAYDFDHAGIVRAPYARPAEELDLSTTLTRRYRGYCVQDMSDFADVFSHFNSLKEEIYNVYKKCVILEESYVKSTVKYLDGFYATINDPKKSANEFMYPCNKSGTGNVVIKGLRKD